VAGGWAVRFDLIELISPDGEVFARDGDILFAGGGLDVDGAFAINPVERDDRFGVLEREALLRNRRYDVQRSCTVAGSLAQRLRPTHETHVSAA
jgi:hypothetical protein